MDTQSFFGESQGPQVPAAVAELLQEAARQFTDTHAAKALLDRAGAIEPDSLAVAFSRYKFHFYSRQFPEAEQVARQALASAARQAALPTDWRNLRRDQCRWDQVDAPQHFLLFTLKALAFIRLRQGDAAECRDILDQLDRLDPSDTVGQSVIRTFLEGSQA